VTDTNVFPLVQPGTFTDRLTDVLREGARSLLVQAVEAEVAGFLAGHADKRTDDGRQRLVRHGHLPERSIMTGIGAVEVCVPRVRDRLGSADDRIRFSSAILPPYARRSKSLEVLIPILYLKGISTGDFAEALSALLGPNAAGLSASTIARLKEVWAHEHARWLKRDLATKRYAYFWADGIYVQARLEDEAQCLLVIIGATPEGKKELVGLADGLRESAQSWRDLLLDLKRRGGCQAGRNWPSAMARSVSGRQSGRFGRLRECNVVGCTRPPTCSTNCPTACTPRPSARCTISGWQRPGAPPKPLSTSSSRPTVSSTRRRPNALPKIVTRCSPSTTFPPSIGNTCGAQTQSRAPLPRSVIARLDRRVVSPTTPHWQ